MVLQPTWANLDVHLGNIPTGSGLMLLIEIATTSLDTPVAAWGVVAGALCFLACAYIASRAGVSGVAPVWLCFASSSVNLLLTLAVALNICARLCPHEGKEVVLIPVYFLLCMSRLQVCLRFPLALFGLLYMLMLLWPSSDQEPLDALQPYAYKHSAPDPASFAAIALLSVYDSLSQLCRLSESLAHFPLDPSWRFKVDLDISKGSGLQEVSAWALVRCLLFVVLTLAKPTWYHTFLSLFLAPLPTYSAPYVFSYLSSVFTFVLLLSCMFAAYHWFAALRWILERVSRRGFPAKRLVRLQHILNALVVGASWAFPLDNPSLSLALRVLAAGIVVGGAVLQCLV
jgi:hypothetical protein